jgi:hypothetical protein
LSSSANLLEDFPYRSTSIHGALHLNANKSRQGQLGMAFAVWDFIKCGGMKIIRGAVNGQQL